MQPKIKILKNVCDNLELILMQNPKLNLLVLSLYGCKEVSDVNGTKTKHEGIFLLHSYYMTTKWFNNQLEYTRKVMMEQAGIDIRSLKNPNNYNFDKESCVRSRIRIDGCANKKAKNQPMYRNAMIIILILLGVLPITFKIFQVMYLVIRDFTKNFG